MTRHTNKIDQALNAASKLKLVFPLPTMTDLKRNYF